MYVKRSGKTHDEKKLPNVVLQPLVFYSHVRVLKGRPRCVQCEPSCGFDRRVGKVQLQGFAFTCTGEVTRT